MSFFRLRKSPLNERRALIFPFTNGKTIVEKLNNRPKSHQKTVAEQKFTVPVPLYKCLSDSVNLSVGADVSDVVYPMLISRGIYDLVAAFSFWGPLDSVQIVQECSSSKICLYQNFLLTKIQQIACLVTLFCVQYSTSLLQSFTKVHGQVLYLLSSSENQHQNDLYQILTLLKKIDALLPIGRVDFVFHYQQYQLILRASQGIS